MSATLLYRIASVLFVLFAAGHTFGLVNFSPPSQEGLAVREAMNAVQFEVRGAVFSYGGFYMGFGLSLTAYLVFSAFLAWHLGTLASRDPEAIGMLAWLFCGLEIVCLVLSWRYFFVVPTILSGVLAACLGWAAWLVPSARPG